MLARARSAWAVRLAIGLATGLAAAPAALAAKPPRVHALVGARIVVAPGKVIESGTVVLREGLIVAVGAGVQAPPDARVQDAKGLTIFPGLIESYSSRPWPMAKEKDAAPQDGLPNPALHPERDMTQYAADEGLAKKLREAGFTTALVAPKDGILRGSSVIVELGDGDAGDNLLRRGFAQHASIHPVARRREGGGYPASLMGAVALFRQTLLDAGWHGRAQGAYARNPLQERPAVEPGLTALAGVAAGKELVIFETDDVLDTLRVAELQRELKLDAAVVGNGEEYKRLDDVKRTGLPHILPLAFPKAPQVSKDDPTIDLEDLRAWDAAPDNPRRLLSTGLEVAFTSYRLDEPKKIYDSLAKAIGRGLTPDQALAALTTTPARFLGLASRLGTIEVGKIADLTVVDGDLFVDKPKIREVWVDGDRYEIRESKAAEVSAAGTWQLVVKTGDGQEIPVTLTITGKGASLAGTVAAMDKSEPLASAEVSGKKLEVSFDGTPFGQPGSISMTLEISGDNAQGAGTSPQGEFTVSGSRTGKPTLEVAP